MPSLCSGSPLGGEKEQKWLIAIGFMPKSKWLRHFMSYFKTCALKQALFFCHQIAAQFQMLRSHQNRSKLHFAAPSAFAHSVRFWAWKKGLLAPFLFLLRRVRDSNPRTCYSQQFSRLPHSTALPTLRGKCRKGNPILQKYLYLIGVKNWANLLTTMYLYKNGLGERIIGIKCVFLEV